MKKTTTSWGHVAPWYNDLLEGNEDSYQRRVILPHMLRLLNLKPGTTVLDVACGQGFFSRAFQQAGAKVIGVDIAPELIAQAKKNSHPDLEYLVAPSHDLFALHAQSIDHVVIILALQNIENVAGTLSECRRVLKATGTISIVLNHPAFRIPKASSWGYDEINRVQYRRIDKYLSESKVKIAMHPGEKPSEHTISFHRPLQYYVKALHTAGFVLTRLEEWNSHKHSVGVKAKPENEARKQIPLFLYLEGGILSPTIMEVMQKDQL